MKKYIILVLLIFFILTTSVYGEYTFGMGRHPDNYYGKVIQLFYSEVFSRLGLLDEITIEYYPFNRLEMMLSEGLLDGDLARTSEYGALHPDFIQISEAAFIINLAAFSWNNTLQITSWDDLRDGDYTIDCMVGNNLCELYLPKGSYEEISHWRQAIDRLLRKRTDIYIIIQETVEHVIDTENIELYNVGIISSEPAHMYLHSRNKELVTPITNMIWKMKHEGYDQKCKDGALILTKDTHSQ